MQAVRDKSAPSLQRHKLDVTHRSQPNVMRFLIRLTVRSSHAVSACDLIIQRILIAVTDFIVQVPKCIIRWIC